MPIHTSAFPFRRHALALALALATGTATAATLNVSGDCSLINAINNANSDTDTDGASGCPAGAGSDTLELESNAVYTLTTANNDSQGSNGLPVVASVITINGNGSTIERSNVAGTPDFRLLYVAPVGNLTLNKLQLSGGKLSGSSSYGGGTINEGLLTVADSTISGNTASRGGGIANRHAARLTITNSLISNNTASSFGGGIENYQASVSIAKTTISGNNANSFGASGGGGLGILEGVVTLVNTVISGNLGRTGGGISSKFDSDPYSYGGCILFLTNSQISGNSSTYNGGGIRTECTTYLTDSTISNNTASGDGGAFDGYWGGLHITNSSLSGNSASGKGSVVNSYWTSVHLTHSTVSGNTAGKGDTFNDTFGYMLVFLTNTIIANNTGGTDCYPYTHLAGINLIDDNSCGAPLSGDPQLRVLLDNGGPTLTHALKANSPAIAAADPTLCQTTDQRNVKRPSSCDLGAFERKTIIPNSVVPLVQLLDDQVASGGISGNSPGQKLDQRIALRNQLLVAGEYRDRNLKIKSCDQLTRTLGYIDADNTPEADDYVTGTGGGLLTDEINALRSDWSCS